MHFQIIDASQKKYCGKLCGLVLAGGNSIKSASVNIFLKSIKSGFQKVKSLNVLFVCNNNNSSPCRQWSREVNVLWSALCRQEWEQEAQPASQQAGRCLHVPGKVGVVLRP